MLYAERHRPRGVGLAGAVHRTWTVAEKNDWQFSNPRIDTAMKWWQIVSKNYLHTSHFQRVVAVTKKNQSDVHQFVSVLNPATTAARWVRKETRILMNAAKVTHYDKDSCDMSESQSLWEMCCLKLEWLSKPHAHNVIPRFRVDVVRDIQSENTCKKNQIKFVALFLCTNYIITLHSTLWTSSYCRPDSYWPPIVILDRINQFLPSKKYFFTAQYSVDWTTQNALHFTPWQTCSFRHQLDFSGKHSSLAAIKQRLFTHMFTTLYRQVLIYTEWTGAPWRERKCPDKLLVSLTSSWSCTSGHCPVCGLHYAEQMSDNCRLHSCRSEPVKHSAGH